ncbi:MAG: Flp pilus assembly complex ATPase component TadA, partial [Clostridia bacterium]|nr:Flp pilus assembly complex ATPase component TadA [Clostridia bacterium]
SSPGAGKTTFVKDLIMQLSKRNLNLSILVVDERGELSGSNSINLGDNVDVILNSTKKFAFQNGIRSLNPDVVVTDEINLDSDLETIEEALTCGVKVIATIHAKNINDLKNKKSFAMLLNKQLFNRYVVLNNSCGPGTLEGVYNESMSCVCC